MFKKAKWVPTILLGLIVTGRAIGDPVALTEDGIRQPFPGITYQVETRHDPPMRLFVAKIDLTNSHVHLRVAPGGPDPDGPGTWQTILMQPTSIATREHFDLVVNGDFFNLRKLKGPDGKEYVPTNDVWGSAQGPAVTDGKAWSTSVSNRPCLVVGKNGKIYFKTMKKASGGDWQVISGNTMLVKKGAVVPHKDTKRNPRTAVGLDADGTTLIIPVVDGRKPGITVGMSFNELAAEMLRLGCREALNLDGGGSSIMAVRDGTAGELHILNNPSDGHVRAVANVLGVTVDGVQSAAAKH